MTANRPVNVTPETTDDLTALVTEIGQTLTGVNSITFAMPADEPATSQPHPPLGDRVSGELETQLTVRLNTELTFGPHETVEVVAGLLRGNGFRDYGKLALLRLMKGHVVKVGLVNIAGWRFGLDIADQDRILNLAYSLVIRKFGKELFPQAELAPNYVQRMREWKATLDGDQMSRYTTGKLKLFGEPGRKQAR